VQQGARPIDPWFDPVLLLLACQLHPPSNTSNQRPDGLIGKAWRWLPGDPDHAATSCNGGGKGTAGDDDMERPEEEDRWLREALA